ncbi:MAG: hypothetical protein Q9214_000219 [Letrouitia sp. 1 TL-2023]
MSRCPPFPIYSPSPFLDTDWDPGYLRKRYKRLQRLSVYRISDTNDGYRSTEAPTKYQYDETASQEQQIELQNRVLLFHPTANRTILASNVNQQNLREDRTLPAIEENSASVLPSHASSETDSESFEDRFERLSQAIKDRLEISFSTPAEDGTVTISTRQGSAVKGQEPRPDLHSPKLVSRWSSSSSENNTTTRDGSIEISGPRLVPDSQQKFVNPSPKGIPSWDRNSSSEWRTISDGTSSTSEDRMERALLLEAGLKLRKGQVKKISPVSPVPLNFDREIGVRTPSIDSNGSKPDLESPSYENSRRAMEKEVHPAFRESVEQGQLHRPLRIWRDEGQREGNIRLPQQRDDGVLENVTNTRQIRANDGPERVADTGGRKREERLGAGQDTAMRPEQRKESRSVWRQVLPGRWRNRLPGLR